MAEIKISDLSIGDWVLYESTVRTVPMKVLEMGEKYTMCDGQIYITGEAEAGRMFCEITDIKPIPLTPEILEKNGFVMSSKYRWSNPSIGCACLRLGTKYWDIRIGGRNRAYRPTRISIDNIVHTHQLQHALRLAGIEKEIEL